MSLLKFFNNIKKNKKIDIYNYGNHKRSFTYIDDIIENINKIIIDSKMSKNIKNSKIYNIGNPLEEIKMFDLAKKINLLLNKNKVLKKYTETTGSPLKRKPHMSRTFLEIASFPKISLDEGLKKTINWYI